MLLYIANRNVLQQLIGQLSLVYTLCKQAGQPTEGVCEIVTLVLQPPPSLVQIPTPLWEAFTAYFPSPFRIIPQEEGHA